MLILDHNLVPTQHQYTRANNQWVFVTNSKIHTTSIFTQHRWAAMAPGTVQLNNFFMESEAYRICEGWAT
jgi:hypothetical protein